jgi:hypothetical protein
VLESVSKPLKDIGECVRVVRGNGELLEGVISAVQWHENRNELLYLIRVGG